MVRRYQLFVKSKMRKPDICFLFISNDKICSLDLRKMEEPYIYLDICSLFFNMGKRLYKDERTR